MPTFTTGLDPHLIAGHSLGTATATATVAARAGATEAPITIPTGHKRAPVRSENLQHGLSFTDNAAAKFGSARTRGGNRADPAGVT